MLLGRSCATSSTQVESTSTVSTGQPNMNRTAYMRNVAVAFCSLFLRTQTAIQSGCITNNLSLPSQPSIRFAIRRRFAPFFRFLLHLCIIAEVGRFAVSRQDPTVVLREFVRELLTSLRSDPPRVRFEPQVDHLASIVRPTLQCGIVFR